MIFQERINCEGLGERSIAEAQKMISEFELGYLRKWVYVKQGSQPPTTLERKNTGE